LHYFSDDCRVMERPKLRIAALNHVKNIGKRVRSVRMV
jgi:hypothetical protein